MVRILQKRKKLSSRIDKIGINRVARKFAVVVAVAVASLAVFAGGVLGARFDFPDPTGWVNDYAGVLSNEEVLEEKIQGLIESDSTEIFVITVDTLPDDVVLEEFVPYLTDEHPMWKAGQEDYDNGVIFTVVVDDRAMRIDTGYGVEGALTDSESKLILDTEVRPLFREGDYDGGVEAGVDGIIAAVRGEYSAAASTDDDTDGGDGIWAALPVCFVIGLFLVPYLAAYLGRTKSWWLGGIIGFVAGVIGAGMVATLVSVGVARYAGFLVCPVISGILGLVFDFILSKTYKVRKSKGLPTTWTSSWGGFSSGGGFSGGGFSGGSSGGFSGGSGGSFGGGGASSGW